MSSQSRSRKTYMKWIISISLLIGLWIIVKNLNFIHMNGADSASQTEVLSDLESCQVCHVQNTGFSEFHKPELIGCVSCHLGNPDSNEKDEAHENMVLIPGNLNDATDTCGKCHPNELQRINQSLMTNNSGLVAVDKFVFGESDSPNHHFDIRELGQSPADQHLRNLCANCHLGAEKSEWGPITELSRGGGCNACHLNYSDGARNDLQTYLESEKEVLPSIHPSTDIKVTDQHCFGCHSRSSRISTNYMGWHETLLDEEELEEGHSYRVFEDKRVYSFQGQDVHHEKGILCIDCHSSHEVMGDGNRYLHAEDAVKIQCSDCHFKKSANTMPYDSLDAESLLVFMHRNFEHTENRILVTEKNSNPLVNTFLEGDQLVMISKKDGRKHEISKQGMVCADDRAHKDMSCATCHSQWAPRCIGCHNVYDDKANLAYDLLDKKMTAGSWVEEVFEFEVDLPALGVRENNGHRKIEPAIPGMIMSIDHGSFSQEAKDSLSFHRLYAPHSPHTTAKEVRSCISCHGNPSALGYGQGKLEYQRNEKSGEWKFTPKYENHKIDNLPEDAWIPFLKKIDLQNRSTRIDFRPLNISEQKRILLVGACLQCHSEEDSMIQNALIHGIEASLLRITDQCLLPK